MFLFNAWVCTIYSQLVPYFFLLWISSFAFLNWKYIAPVVKEMYKDVCGDKPLKDTIKEIFIDEDKEKG